MNRLSVRYPDLNSLPAPFPWRKWVARAILVGAVAGGIVFVAVV